MRGSRRGSGGWLVKEVSNMNITTMTDDTGMAPKDSLWTAIDYDTYDDGSGPIGSGATEDEAIADLMEKLTD